MRALAGAGFTHLEQLVEVREADVLALHGMGPKALGILKAALKERGLDFAPWPQKTRHEGRASV